MTTDEKIDRILEEVTAQKVHREQHRKELDAHRTDLDSLKRNQNVFFGVVSVIGTGASAFFAWLFKHL